MRPGGGAGGEEGMTGQEDLLSALRETLGTVLGTDHNSNIPAFYEYYCRHTVTI